MKPLIAAALLAASLVDTKSAFSLQGLGNTDFVVDEAATTAVYSQTTGSLVFNSSYVLGDTLGGAFAGGAQDWSLFSTFGLCG